ncbi:GtrA family protein [Streptomyces armeniacus]|uniref:GtrA family protein n=1 Tax=Streptomyces armeniacus TaxID=83291 RepID=A0A345XQK0_9ACTN|nr:GtrA family protein [Streptomyces armeniacus]AXK33916.1 GtrA family protein [Streptomyces armeniacus]
MSEWRGVRSRLERLVRELAKFGTVGAFGFLVNVAVFNLCIHTLGLATVRSGVIATAVAIGTNYVGNRYWTYRHSDKSRVHREVSLFLLFSGIGMVIENGVLALSHYGLDYTSPLADNIAKNVIGLGIGTVFRFWSYRTWVFRDSDAAREREEAALAEARERRAAGAGSRSGGRAGVAGLPAQEEREDRRVLLK